MTPKPPSDNPRNDPWLFECKASRNTLHHWVMNPDEGTSKCKNCGVIQTVEQTKRCFTEY